MKASQYRGVRWRKDNGKWEARITIDGKQKHLGLYEKEDDAARAYDARAREEWGSSALCNFFENGDRNEGVGTQTSGYKGVVWHTRDRKWQAQIKPPNGKRRHHLGYFDNEEAAARKFDDISEYYGRGRPNFPNTPPRFGLTEAEYCAAQGGLDDNDDEPQLKRRRRAAREQKNDVEVARLTVHIIFAKRMLKVAQKLCKTADSKRRARRQADLLGLWLERDDALRDPLEWKRDRKRRREAPALVPQGGA